MPRNARPTRAQSQKHRSPPVDHAALQSQRAQTIEEIAGSAVESAVKLTGAQRVLVLVDEAGGPRIAAARLPHSESPAALLKAITPWLEEARHSGAARLRY